MLAIMDTLAPGPTPNTHRQDQIIGSFLLCLPLAMIAVPIVLGHAMVIFYEVLILIGLVAFVVIATMWVAMVARFSRKPFSRFLFACFTLMLMCTGIGWFALLFIYLWVMDSKPDIFTGEPLARGPKRDAWLAQRKPQTIHTQAVNIDARQVHYHEW